MKILFNIEYHTTFGENLVLNILSGKDVAKAAQHKMQCHDGQHWTVEITKPWKDGMVVDYYYSVIIGDEEKRHECKRQDCYHIFYKTRFIRNI